MSSARQLKEFRSKPAMWEAGVIKLLLSLCLVTASGLSCQSHPGPAQFDLLDKGGKARQMPVSLRATWLQARQNEASVEHAFLPIPNRPTSLRTQNPAKGLEARLDQNGLRLRGTNSPSAPEVSMTLTAQGCVAEPHPASPVVPRAAAGSHKAEYVREGITEWYTNGPLGLEHGFTVVKDLGCREGRLMFGLTVAGEVEAALVGQGSETEIVFQDTEQRKNGRALVYGGLFAVDADGRELPSRLLLSERIVRIEVDAEGAHYPVTIDPIWTELTKLVSSDGAAYDNFGWAVAMSGDTAIVGAKDKTVGGNRYQGQAYIYARYGSTWHEQAKLVPSDGSGGDEFGVSVGISGDTAIVGSYSKMVDGKKWQGQAYIFVRSGSTWSEQAKLIASDGTTSDLFGTSVAVSGDTAIVGALSKSVGTTTGQGQAYVFVRSGTSWSEQAKLVASDGAKQDYFGCAVAVTADTAVIGARDKWIGAHPEQGQVYVFVRSGTSWSEQTKLVASDGAAHDWFGFSLAISGNTVVVSAYLKTIGINNAQGQAYVYVRSGTAWSEQAKLITSDGAAVDDFAFSVAISGDRIICGAPSKDVGLSLGQGEAYVFARSGSSWTEQAKLLPSDGTDYDHFGIAVAISGDTAFVGSERTVLSNKVQGQAYVFVRPASSGTAPNGTSCTESAQCTSTFCVDGLCCDSPCGDGITTDCRSCKGAQTGTSDGVCGMITNAAGYACRPSVGDCDKPELCDGVYGSCPADTFYAAADRHICRESPDCASASYCDGRASCPLTVCLPPVVPGSVF